MIIQRPNQIAYIPTKQIYVTIQIATVRFDNNGFL